MEITGTALQVFFSGEQEPPPTNGNVEDLTEQSSTPEYASAVPNPTTDPEPVSPEKVRGVIRLLQEGHFKGVADVSLRINFFEELNAIEQKEMQAVVGDKVSGIVDSAGSDVETLLGLEGLTEEQSNGVMESQKTFAQAVNQSKEEFLASEQPSRDDLIIGLTSAFEAFVTSLESVLLPPVPEASEDDLIPPENMEPEDPPIDSTEDESANVIEPEPILVAENNFQTFIQDLEEAFAIALNELTDALNEIKVLPELSEPMGNGVAYDKFLAIYNQLLGIETTDETPAVNEPVDTVV
ncbi:MAG: hypothetical protein JRG97_12785 [Deltaproteobacteria bacterium]|nr:hypothetical protein [Deltaproteobacteria bacterium]MBW2141924.1 hypothetical protein [Deltaproteobacteria bacterium]MBW2323453.1 hypothetical protein [Deltaproteobacteria bacterium]